MLPPPIFVGRERELQRLDSALALVAVAVIDGVAGVGKSTLARAAAARWTGPAATATLRTSATIAALSEHVHRQLGVIRYDLAANDDERLVQLWRLLDVRGALLVVDDLQLWEAERRALVVRSALAGLGRGRLMAMSRELVPLGPDDPDRLQLRLEGLDRPAAEELWNTLIALYGPARDFEAAWQRSRGNPFLLRQAHVRHGDDESPLDGLVASLTSAERALANLIAVAQSPLPAGVLEAAGCDPAVLQALAVRLVVDVDADGSYAVHELVRDQLLRTSEVATARRCLADALQAAPALGATLRVQEAARQLRALGDEPAIGALVHSHARALVAEGADGVLLHELDALAPAIRTPALERLRARVRCAGLQVRRAYQGLAAAADPSPETQLCLASVATWAGELDHALALLGPLAVDPRPAVRDRVAIERAWAEIARGDRVTPVAPRSELAVALRCYDACLADRASEAADLASELVARLQTGASPDLTRSMIPALCGITLARDGRLDQADQAIAWAARELAGPADRLEMRWARAVIVGERGNHDAALAELSAMLPVIDRGGFFVGAMWTRVVMIRFLVQLGRRDAALAIAAEARALAERHGSTAFETAIAHAEHADRTAGPPLVIDARRHELRVGGAVLCSLATRTSLRGLLYAFAAAPGSALDRDAIAAVLWSAAYDPLRHESSIKSSIRRLRALLVGTGATIEAISDGYRLDLPPLATFQRAGCPASQRSTRAASDRVLGVA